MIQARDSGDYLTLVAIARAAHIVGDRRLKQRAVRELCEDHGIAVTFRKQTPCVTSKSDDHNCQPSSK